MIQDMSRHYSSEASELHKEIAGLMQDLRDAYRHIKELRKEIEKLKQRTQGAHNQKVNHD